MKERKYFFLIDMVLNPIDHALNRFSVLVHVLPPYAMIISEGIR